MCLRVLFFILIVGNTFNFVHAQHPFYYSINDENGLPSNEVYQIVQDKFGYIWIGCDAGLFKYDGFEFKQYKYSNQNGRSISGLQLDQKGRIWCRNFNGQIYRVNGDSLILIKDLKQNTANNVFALDKNCNAWIVCKNKLVEHNDQGKVITTHLIPNSLGDNNFIIDILYFKDKIFLSQLGRGIYGFDFKHFNQLNITSEKELIIARSSFFTKNNQLFLLSEESHGKDYLISGIRNNNIEPLKKAITKTDNKIIYKINSFNSHESWVCSSTGVFPYDILSEDLDQIKGFFADKKVSYCIKDRESMYWFSTLNDGIFIIPSMDVIKFDPSNSHLLNKNVTALGKNFSKDLLIGLASGEINILKNENVLNDANIISDQKLLTTKKIQTYKGLTFIAHGQLTLLNKDNSYKALPFYNIRDFVIYQDTLYYVTSDFVFKIALKYVLKGDQSKLKIIRRSGGRNVALDEKNKRIYFVLNEGVYYYEKLKLKKLIYNGNSVYASSIIIKNDKLWVASISSGLLVFNHNQLFKKISYSNGLKESEIKFLNSSFNNVWACGNSFLYRISIKTGKIDCFNKSTGINATEIKTIEILNGKVYLGTNKGLIVFPENLQSMIKTQPKIEIKSILQGNQSINYADGINLNYDHKNIYINLSSTSFKSKSNFYYLYRIKGLSDEWIKIPVQNKTLILSSIPSGSFLIEIKSVNESGISSELIRLPLMVESPLWEKWWFYLVITILSIGIIATIFIIRIRFIRRRALLHSKLISSQLTALKAQMNPHFMYNALNSIQDLVLEKDIKNSNLYLSKFSKLMRKILDASGMEKISLQDEIDILNLYLELERLRFGDDFTYAIDWNHSIDMYEIHIPSMIIQPFVENAIKHGLLHKKGIKKLSIIFDIKEETIVCTLIDNGVGRKHANEIKERRAVKHRSFATEATEKRIELLNKMDQENYKFEIIDLVEGENSLGTKVIIVLPI